MEHKTNIIMEQMKELVFRGESNQSLTSSLLVAEKFGKRHVDVIDAIRVYVENSTLTDNQCISNMFVLTDYDVDMNNGTGAFRKAPMYVMNRDGFTLLAMGFTGEKALKFKIEYINAFNKMEAELKSQFKVPSSFKEALMLAVEQQELIEQQQLLIEEQKPKAEFFDAVADSKDAIPMLEVAKVLNAKGMGRNNLFEFLREQKVLMRDNLPYEKYIDRGYFRVIEQKYMKNGEPCMNTKTLVYQRGLDFIRKLIEKNE